MTWLYELKGTFENWQVNLKMVESDEVQQDI